jgi:hypothetical protein
MFTDFFEVAVFESCSPNIATYLFYVAPFAANSNARNWSEGYKSNQTYNEGSPEQTFSYAGGFRCRRDNRSISDNNRLYKSGASHIGRLVPPT